MESTNKSNSLRAILEPFTGSYPSDENAVIIATRPDFVRVSGHKFYVIHKTADTTLSQVCGYCEKRPFKGFIVKTKRHHLGSNLAIYQCDYCHMIQVIAIKQDQMAFFFPDLTKEDVEL